MYTKYNEEENNTYLADLITTISELPTSRQEAEEIKSIFFKSKYGCKNGHFPIRFTSNSRCVGCVRKSKRKHFVENKREIYKKAVEKQGKRYKEDPNFRAATILRSIVKRMFKAVGANKDGKTFDLLGYSKEEFMTAIESKFYGGMTWLNHGSVWELDHVIPLTAFNLGSPEHRNYVNSLENLQPLSLDDHSAKTSLDIARLRLLKSSGVLDDSWKWLIVASN